MAREYSADIIASLRRAFVGSTVSQSTDDPVAVLPFDAVVIRGETNADFARVRAIKRTQPNKCVIVVAARDRSEAAYVAGANEFASCLDHERIAQALRETLALSQQIA